MATTIISESQELLVIQVEIPFGRPMLEGESLIQDALNDAGTLATDELLKQFDTNGAPIKFRSVKMTSKGLVTKQYQTPYVVAEIARHVYQTAEGGETFCPLDGNARIVVISTLRFAKQISHKFSEMALTQVEKDLAENNNRKVARSYLQNVADAVGTTVHACCCAMMDTAKNTTGERIYTTYLAAPPEYGKAQFKKRLEEEIMRTKQRYSKAHYPRYCGWRQ